MVYQKAPLFSLWSCLNKAGCLSAFLLLFCFQNSFPQYPEKLYGPEEGLSHSTVLDINRDENGFIWVFTLKGLCRFDGYHFKEYKVLNKDLVTDIKGMGCFIKDSKNRLWIRSSPNLLSVYNSEKDKIETLSDSVDYYVSFGEYNTDIWAIGINSIINFQESEAFYFTSTNYSLPEETGIIYRILPQVDGSLITITENGLFILKPFENNFQVQKLTSLVNGLPNIHIDISSKFIEINQILYLTNARGIYKTNIHLNHSAFADSVVYLDLITMDFPELGIDPEQPIYAVVEGEKNEIFIRSLNGIYKYNFFNDNMKRIKEEYYGISDMGEGEFRFALMYDSDKILWAGTDKGLLKIVTPNKDFQVILPEPENPKGLKFGKLNQAMIDSNGDLWIGTVGDGLYHSVPDKNNEFVEFENFKPDGSNQKALNSTTISVLTEDSKQNLWIGAIDLQSIGLNEKTMIFKNTPITDYVRLLSKPLFPSSIIEDPEGNIICIGTPGELSNWQYRPDVGKGYYLYLDSTKKLINCPRFYHTRDDQFYMYANKSFFKLTNGWTFKEVDYILGKEDLKFKEKINLKTLLPYAYPSKIDTLLRFDENKIEFARFIITEKSQEIELWINFMYEKKILRYSIKQLLTQNANFSNPDWANMETDESPQGINLGVVYEMIEDNSGRVWCSTQDGLISINPETNHAFTYYIEDGLPTNKLFWGISKDNIGRIFVCTTNGLLFFNPDSISPDPPAMVKLTELFLFNELVEVDENSILTRNISETKSLQLSHNQNYLGFKFSALEYRNTERVKYRYKLEGVDKDWIEQGKRLQADYYNLDPGKYTFHVIAANGNNVWNSEGVSLSIRILSPLWFRWWAIVIEALGLIFILIFYIRYRERELQQRAILLEEKVDEKTREVLEQRKEVDEMKSRFYTNISHEFRTPLTLLVGPLEDSVKSCEENVPMSRKILCIMLRNARRLQRLINQLLDISKIESGTMELRLIKNDLAEFVKVIGGSFLSLAESQKIKYRVQVDIKDRELCFDPDKLEKVVTNLLSNAFKFTPREGEVMLSLEMQNGSMKAEVLEAVLTVSDTGRGIPKDQIDHIFDRFFQVSDSDTRDVEGSGIGLALSKELVELMHGSIEVESNPGEGSKFIVKFPVSEHCFTEQELADLESGVKIREEWDEEDEEKLADVYEESLEEGSDETGEIRKEIILIVEDNPDLRNYIRDQFNSEYHIIEAQNGQTGYEKAVQHIPDLIVTDLMMPVMGGMEMCQKVKTHPLTSHIPVIMLTAKADKESKLEGLETNADDYIIKPFDAELLVVRAKNLIRQRKELRQRFEKTFLLEDNGNMDAIPFNMLKEILEVIRENLSDEDFSVNKLGDELHMSRSGVFRKIRSVAGITPIELLRMIRMKEAARLLRKNELNITQIMYQVGLKNPSHFALTFKKFYGVNPSEYR
ncbi:MAG: response regulator [Bacteroidales bacterium]|nr:response regulator [Bacteroidales bacterium]